MNIYITLDYELFMNDRTGDVENCLITPTNELLKVLDKYRVKAVFFVDAAYIYRLNELKSSHKKLESDFLSVSKQIRELVLKGHTIALHIHPQWFYAEYNGNQWLMDFEHYKLSDIEPENLAEDYFKKCYSLLSELSNSKITAFRAGGYSIQSFKHFEKMLRDCAINHDSSVLPGMKNLSHLHYYDYTKVKNTDSYSFSGDVSQPDINGENIEHPISTGRVSYFRYCYYRFKYGRIKGNNNWGNGGPRPAKGRKKFLKNVLAKAKLTVPVSATIDYQSFFFCDLLYKEYLTKDKKDFVIIGHPKNFSPVSLAALDDFLSRTWENNTYHCFAENF